MVDSQTADLDEIDRLIIATLSDNPRMPYSDIAAELEKKGYQMSGEGIRHRVKRLLDSTSTFFMLNPESHDWHVLRVTISVDESADAKQSVIGELQERPFWFLSSGLGSFDIYANGLAKTLAEVDELVANVRGIDEVETVEFFLETQRQTDMQKYFPVDGST